MIERLQNMFAGASLRARYGIVVLGLLVGLVWVLGLGDDTRSAASERAAAERRFAQYGEGVDGELWATRAASAEAARAAWAEREWRGPTPGVIAAQVQARLAAIAEDGGLASPRVEVDPAPITIGEVSALRFRLSGRARSGHGGVTALSGLAANTPLLILDDTSVTLRSDFTMTMTLEGIAPIRTVQPSEAGS